MIINVNGRLIHEKDAVISAYDHGFLYGIGLFETFRTYGGAPFLLKEHLVRLAKGCEQLGIRYSPDEKQIRDIIERLLEANKLGDAYFRLTITAGQGILSIPTDEYLTPTSIMYIKQLPTPPILSEPQIKALQLIKLPRNTPEGAYRLKSLHYMNNIMGKREMSVYPWLPQGAEGIFLDGRGYVAEGIVSNVFFIKERIVYTPSIDTGILAGITRQFVIDLLENEGIRVQEGLYTWEELMSADEVFVTNSIQEVVPVHILYDLQGTSFPIGESAPGKKLTQWLISCYRKHTEVT